MKKKLEEMNKKYESKINNLEKIINDLKNKESQDNSIFNSKINIS